MSPDQQRHQYYMQRCVDAIKAQTNASTYPLAAAVVLGNELLSIECSKLPAEPDPSAHPEMRAVRAAAAHVDSRYLPGAVLYSTLEPCPMCTSVAIWAKMDGIAYGASQEEVIEFAQEHRGSSLTWRQIRISSSTVVAAGEPKLWVTSGVLHEECLSLLRLTAERSRQRARPN
jgi:tRNA(Arg) A34 adenosine deaminase TadA